MQLRMRYIGFRVSSLVAATTYSLVTGRVSLIRASRARTTSLGFTRLLAVTMSTTAKTSSNATSQPSTIAVGQVCSTSNKISNLQQIAQCAGWAKSKHATMLFLPEVRSNETRSIQPSQLCTPLDQQSLIQIDHSSYIVIGLWIYWRKCPTNLSKCRITTIPR